jgi:hypothetical protein
MKRRAKSEQRRRSGRKLQNNFLLIMPCGKGGEIFEKKRIIIPSSSSS